ncbi:hypothetical protein JQ628_15890 [Bradyrhizobium lablabi]|uniref:hypothetical protein n=1 Tax=Bradyrhizobium lablabi TaxID=722472 RepID=UPI001BA4F44F|nr:hypothetical protein [Bradyrhizobium lablabi]MBR1123008.1 hypothetical protein [Bradyrhizobium lablabi]
MNPMAWFLVTAGIVSAIVFWMMTRLGSQRPAARRSAYDGATDSGFASGTGGGGDGWSLSSWLGGHSSSSHDSGSSSDSSSSGGGDGGDGGGGGGGGGGD